MSGLSLWMAVACLFVVTLAPLADSNAQNASTKCEADTLSRTLHERMLKDGKTDAEISAILASSFKRGVLKARVADGSGCTAAQADKALDALKVLVAKS